MKRLQIRSTARWLPAFLLAGAFVGGAPAVAEDLSPERAAGQAMYIVGTQLMEPYIAAIAERLTRNAGLSPPIIENRSTTRGIKTFCSGLGLNTPDVVAISRHLHGTELEDCRAHGVEDVIGILVGYDATVVVSRSDDLDYPLTLQSFYRAVAAELPEGYEFLPNPNTHWQQADPVLPNTGIRVILPAPTLGGRAFLDDHMLQGACRNIFEIHSIFSAEERVAQCIALRKDDRIFELDAPDDFETKMVQALATSPRGTLAVVPLRFATNHPDALEIQPIDGVVPNRETVSNRSYSLVRPLYFFIKKAHVKNYLGEGPVRGLRELITEIVRDTTFGPGGYLSDLGLIPMGDLERAEERAASLKLSTLVR